MSRMSRRRDPKDLANPEGHLVHSEIVYLIEIHDPVPAESPRQLQDGERQLLQADLRCSSIDLARGLLPWFIGV